MTVEFPGLFDIQVNGFGGIDFNGRDLTPDRVGEALDRMRATGVTRSLPTLITSSFEDFAASASAISRIDSAALAGIHMEGPYLSPEEGARGAHPPEHLALPNVDDFRRRQEAARGLIRLVTLAPELPGALDLIELLVDEGIRVAVGHTLATAAQIGEAISAGATLATHLGNGCPQMLPRHPNHMWELLAADAIHASFIVDGHHLPPSTVKAMIRAKGPERAILVTDAGAAAGCAPGRYRIGGVDCELGEDGRVSFPGTPYLAGSALRLDEAVANTVRYTGLPFDDVMSMASSNPAAYLGLPTAGRVTADWDAEAGRLHIRSVSAS